MNCYRAALVAVIFGLTGCAAMTGITRVYTPDETAYLDRAMASPAEIIVTKAKSEEAWGRAQSFIGRFSDMKIQVGTEYETA